MRRIFIYKKNVQLSCTANYHELFISVCSDSFMIFYAQPHTRRGRCCCCLHQFLFVEIEFLMLASEAKYSKYFHKTQIRIKRCFNAVSKIETVSCNRQREGRRRKFAFCSDRNLSCKKSCCGSLNVATLICRLAANTSLFSFLIIETATATAKDLAGVFQYLNFIDEKFPQNFQHARERTRCENVLSILLENQHTTFSILRARLFSFSSSLSVGHVRNKYT